MTPTRPPHPCAKPGCGKLVTGRSHCDEHEATRRRKDPEQVRFYRSSFWTRLSRMVRRMRPVCEECRSKPSKVVDHMDGDYRNCAPTNLRALCVQCNATKTAKQHRGKVGGA